jgi:two-component system cell cycle response regulator DivK
MDGYAVARALRADSALDPIPVVAVTSYAMPGDRERCLESGCDGYLEKPIDPQAFADQVEAFLPPGAARPEGAAQ